MASSNTSAFKSSLFKNVALVVVSGAATYGFIQWQAQQAKLAHLAQTVQQLQQSAVAEVATRNASVDLLGVGSVVATQPAPAVPAAVPAPAIIEETTADKVRNLTAQARQNLVAGTPISELQKLETLAVIHAGVQELVAAVVRGDYEIHTDYEDEHFSGRIHFAFIGHEEDQVELEQYLAAAAEAGIVAHSSSVVDGDGRVNGHILLFDLVERALENGTPAEQAASKKMRAEAVAMLAATAPENATSQNARGQRTYVVKSGDSLAYIALQFYGNTQDFARIFNANRDRLSSPELINVGQELIIPEV